MPSWAISLKRGKKPQAAIARSRAELKRRQGGPAAAEFQKLIDHPGVVLNEPISALAHLGLALSGEKVKARAAYRDFLALWKSPDPDIPIYIQAKSECAALK